MIKFNKIVIIILIIIILNQILRKTNINNFNIEEKINIILKKNDIFSISLLPSLNRDNDLTEEFKILVDRANLNSKSLNILEKNKVSIKIRQLGKNLNIQLKRLKNIKNYAKKKNVFIWIASVLKKDINMEFEEYKKLFEKYDNVGLTIATVNHGAMDRVKEIINIGGKIRLVKGHYHGDIKNWNLVTQKYEEISEVIVKSGQYHCLATHDFKILKKLKNKYPIKFNNVELAFYYSAYDFVYKKENINIIRDNIKCFYIFYGDYIYYIIDNILEINLNRIIARLINK